MAVATKESTAVISTTSEWKALREHQAAIERT
jgi:hypothetical protein